MTKLVQSLGAAACVAGFSLVGCSSIGAPHPGGNPSTPSRAHAPVLHGARLGFTGLDVRCTSSPTTYTHTGVNSALAATYLDYAELL